MPPHSIDDWVVVFVSLFDSADSFGILFHSHSLFLFVCLYLSLSPSLCAVQVASSFFFKKTDESNLICIRKKIQRQTFGLYKTETETLANCIAEEAKFRGHFGASTTDFIPTPI